MVTEPRRCPAYSQIEDRGCCYDEGHGGKHNFARLDHNYALERSLRRALDRMIAARDEACAIAETAIKMRGDFIVGGNKSGRDRIAALRSVE